MKIICSIRNLGDVSLSLTLDKSPFDSLDLLELRAALETLLDRELSDEKFNSKSTLRDLYQLVSR